MNGKVVPCFCSVIATLMLEMFRAYDVLVMVNSCGIDALRKSRHLKNSKFLIVRAKGPTKNISVDQFFKNVFVGNLEFLRS